MGRLAPWEPGEEFRQELAEHMEGLITLLDKGIDNAVRESLLAPDGGGVTIYFKSDDDHETFLSPLTLMFQVDLGSEEGDPVREIDIESIIDYELDEVHEGNLKLYESLAAEMERLATKTRARVKEVKANLEQT